MVPHCQEAYDKMNKMQMIVETSAGIVVCLSPK